jgi:hypothetical protein
MIHTAGLDELANNLKIPKRFRVLKQLTLKVDPLTGDICGWVGFEVPKHNGILAPGTECILGYYTVDNQVYYMNYNASDNDGSPEFTEDELHDLLNLGLIEEIN